jgi:hypothetical protein
MTRNRQTELDDAHYKSMLFMLNNAYGIPDETISLLRSKTQGKLHDDIAKVFKTLTDEARVCMQLYDELCDTDPTDMSVMYENVDKQAFRSAALISVELNRLNELRQILRELNQLDK